MLLMGKLTISMAMFNSYVTNCQRLSPNSYYRTNIFLNMAIYSEFAMFNSYDCPEAVEKPLPLKQIWEKHSCSIHILDSHEVIFFDRLPGLVNVNKKRMGNYGKS